MVLLRSLFAYIVYCLLIFLLTSLLMVAAALASVFLYPILVDEFPELSTLMNGYFLPVMSCFPFLFIPSYIKKSNHFLGIDVLYRMVDLGGTGFDEHQKMPYDWKF